jgi:D-threo-aldose 1-dehydrogenase
MDAGLEKIPTRRFGPTDLRVTSVCLGTAALGNMPEAFAFSVSEQQAVETLRAVFRSPLNFVDTAASYGDGESERRIGLVLRELGGLPAGSVLATKADRGLQTGDFSGDQMRRSVERSLRLLGLDRLQLLYLHDPEHTTFEAAMAAGGPVEALARLKEQGVIQHLGISGGPIDLLIRFVETGAFGAVITHNRYTLLNHTAEPLIDLAAQRGLAVVNAAPYGSGLLVRGPDAYPRYAYQDAPVDLLDRTRRIEAVCRRFGVPLQAAALHFSLKDPRITSTIVGVTHPDHVRETTKLMEQAVPDELWTELEAFGGWQDDPELNRWERARGGA